MLTEKEEDYFWLDDETFDLEDYISQCWTDLYYRYLFNEIDDFVKGKTIFSDINTKTLFDDIKEYETIQAKNLLKNKKIKSALTKAINYFYANIKNYELSKFDLKMMTDTEFYNYVEDDCIAYLKETNYYKNYDILYKETEELNFGLYDEVIHKLTEEIFYNMADDFCFANIGICVEHLEEGLLMRYVRETIEEEFSFNDTKLSKEQRLYLLVADFKR